MDVKEFTFRLVILFFPGLIAFMLYDRLTIHRKVEPFFFALNSFVFGVLAYFCTWVPSLTIFPTINTRLGALNAQWLHLGPWVSKFRLPTKLVLWDELQTTSGRIELGEIGWSCVTAICVALVFAWVSNRKLHYRAARRFGISQKSGEIDVWGYVMNSREENSTWVTIRDTDTDLMYDGWIESFSEEQSITELFLRDVAVYRNSTTEVLYQIGAMYFKIDPKKVILEFRAIPVSDNHRIEQKENDEQREIGRGDSEKGRSEPAAEQPTSATSPTTATRNSATPTEKMM